MRRADGSSLAHHDGRGVGPDVRAAPPAPQCRPASLGRLVGGLTVNLSLVVDDGLCFDTRIVEGSTPKRFVVITACSVGSGEVGPRVGLGETSSHLN